jgi:hypothetical protein
MVMGVLDLYYRSAQRRLDLLQVEVREEPWMVAHREAEGCHYFELAIGHVFEVVRYFREIEQRWRQAVYRGVEPPSDSKGDWLKEGFTRWLGLAQSFTKNLQYFETRGYQIDRAADFRHAVVEIETALANWTPPLPARSPAMRVEDISEEEDNPQKTN